MALYDTIQFLCKQNKISIAQLEKQLNIGNGTIARWNKGFPTIDNAIKVARFFEISLDYLTGDLLGQENTLILTPLERDLICKWRSADRRDKDLVDFILSQYQPHDANLEIFDDLKSGNQKNND